MLSIFVQSLAIARLLKLLVEEEGPWKVFERFRSAIGIDAYGGHDEDNQLAGLFSCPWCLGLWVAPVIFITYKCIPWAVYILAVAELGGLLNSLADRLLYED
ncbi:MAG: DUF1360 domain-containing protein [Deltaproteobacteria bacterium]|nr:DUF1360 domain-containing protein [Deltaproteobacteria bacterium]